MNTEDRSISLRAGQALEVDPHVPATLYLLEGEVLVQPPLAWLAGQVVVARARRIAAPAVLQAQDVAAAVAVGAARIRVQRPATLLEKSRRAWAELVSPARARTALR
ncbi:hypothetical protein LZ009_16915 [Ramlibacter sp. XY19]|uniref:hypothetical protein n=1 Tax=Ramlibacter paludis TaxID=2908000 RepID=UPI0023DAB573|nr:hypothetical protein [Ramlibacter paludis]MCG2594461.1 hypothetical protein [Ramlibacter paludis]